MDYRNLKISETTAQEIIDLAIKLYAQDKQKVSGSELVEIGEAAQIPSEFIEKALEQIYSRNTQVLDNSKKNYLGYIFLLLLMFFSSGVCGFLGYQLGKTSQPSALKPTLSEILIVKKNKLSYFNDKLLAVAVEDIFSEGSVDANIGVNGYENLNIRLAKIGSFYEYQGKNKYHIRIIEVNTEDSSNFVKFQIDKLN